MWIIVWPCLPKRWGVGKCATRIGGILPPKRAYIPDCWITRLQSEGLHPDRACAPQYYVIYILIQRCLIIDKSAWKNVHHNLHRYISCTVHLYMWLVNINALYSDSVKQHTHANMFINFFVTKCHSQNFIERKSHRIPNSWANRQKTCLTHTGYTTQAKIGAPINPWAHQDPDQLHWRQKPLGCSPSYTNC